MCITRFFSFSLGRGIVQEFSQELCLFFCDKSMKFGTLIPSHMTSKSGYRDISDLTFSDL